MKYIPSYLKLHKTGELNIRIEKANEILRFCKACPRNCCVNRFYDQKGYCQSGKLPIVSSYTPHFGEEPVISGTKGAGNIFFGNCNLKCVYCQNHEISQNHKHEIMNEVSFEDLAKIMLKLQEANCHNIGFVSPSHFSPQILISLEIAIEKGLKIPLIYNSNGYDSSEMIKLFDGIIDIYLPDIKYADDAEAFQYSNVKEYFECAKKALLEMFSQVGDKLIIEEGILKKGLIIRHLVLPNNIAESEEIFRFISRELSNEIHLSVMSQYFPAFKAENYPLLSRRINEREYERVLELLEKYNLRNGWVQEPESYENYRPHFNSDRANPFNN